MRRPWYQKGNHSQPFTSMIISLLHERPRIHPKTQSKTLTTQQRYTKSHHTRFNTTQHKHPLKEQKTKNLNAPIRILDPKKPKFLSNQIIQKGRVLRKDKKVRHVQTSEGSFIAGACFGREETGGGGTVGSLMGPKRSVLRVGRMKSFWWRRRWCHPLLLGLACVLTGVTFGVKKSSSLESASQRDFTNKR